MSLVLVAARPAAAVQVELWTITPLTFTAYADQAQSVTFTATNLSVAVPPSLGVIGCVRLNVPNSVTLNGAAMVSPTNGTWTATVVGGGVTVSATTMDARIGFNAAVQFSISITPNQLGEFLFGARAFENTNCSAPQFGGSNNIAATIVPPILPTASPIPTVPPLPTPLPTVPPLPTALPLPTPAPTARPTGGASPTPVASPPDASARPSPTPRSSTAPGSSTAPAESAGGLTLGPGGQQGAGDDLLVDIGTGTGLDGIVWTVPAVALGSPGIALILWIAIQTASGVVWLPWVRRLRRTRRERSRSPA
ncbi:MAG: hypothetical protein WD116_01110 [Chloroflexota bacterium]